MVLSIVYGMVFGALAASKLRGQMAHVGLGSLFGLVLWLVNFYVIAAMAFPWFLEANPIVQFIAHTFFFGTVLGYSLWKARENTAADGTRGSTGRLCKLLLLLRALLPVLENETVTS